MPGTFCRLCLKTYTKSDVKTTITDNFIGRLRDCGITFLSHEHLKETTTVHRDCFNALKNIEKGEQFREKWTRSTAQKRKRYIVDDSPDSEDDEDQVMKVFHRQGFLGCMSSKI